MIQRRLILIILLAFSVISVVTPIVSFAYSDFGYDMTDVLDDLSDLNLSKFPADPDSELQVIKFMEYCYSPLSDNLGNYGLYLYVYNPKLYNILLNSGANVVQLSTGKGSGNYKKYPLKHLSSSTDNLFHKFKVILPSSFAKCFNGVEYRYYNISSVEFRFEYGDIHDFGVGGKYEFSGYSAGYGLDPNAESTLKCTVTYLETVDLSVNFTNYFAGLGNQNDTSKLVSSVYFSVPNRFFRQYGKLQGIRAEWYEYKTAPVFVTKDESVYYDFLPFVGLPASTSGNKYLMGVDYYTVLSAQFYTWAYNAASNIFIEANNPIDYVHWWLYDPVLAVSPSEMISYARSYNKSVNNSWLDIRGGLLSSDLFLSTVDEGRTMGYNLRDFDADEREDLLVFDNSNSWKRFFAYWFGAYSSVVTFSPIEVVNDSLSGNASDISKDYLISPNDVKNFKKFHDEESTLGRKTVILRFAVTDYLAKDLHIRKGLSLKHGLFSQQTLFFDFDIISLTFFKDGVNTIIPVVADPIDIAAGVFNPNANHSSSDSWGWLVTLLIIILVIWILNVIGVLPYVFKAIGWVVTAPFKAISKLFNSFKKKE